MNLLNQIEPVIRKYASIPVAIFCLGALYLFISIGYLSVIGPILGATVGALMAIFILHVIRPKKEDITTTPPDHRIAVIITCIYVFAIFTIYRFTLYEQPLAHYLVFGGFAGYIAYEIATGARRIRVIPQLLVLTFFTYWSVQLAFPAGMSTPDTQGLYLPAIRNALIDGTIEGLIPYLGHLTYVTENILVTGLSIQTGYFLLATLVLTSTLLMISILDCAFPSISRQVALYSALFFGCMGWTLGRGFHPNKLNFFYALTLLLGFVVIIQLTATSQQQRRLWTVIGIIIGPALIFGHRFSAGAALIFLIAIAAFALFAPFISGGRLGKFDRGPAIIFAIAYGLVIIGTPIHAESITTRFVGLIISVFFSGASGGGSGGGPGRYSELPIELLFASTAGQAILFGLGVLGAAIAIRRRDWEFDLGIFWMGVLAVFLAVALVFNASDTQPQRFYSLLGLFGLNVFGGVALVYLVQSDMRLFNPRVVAIVIFAFAVLSMGSPVAGMHLSFVSNDVPHNPFYDTNQLNEGENWINTYEGNKKTILETSPPITELPYEATSRHTATVNTSKIESGNRYVYTQLAADTGIRNDGGLGLGDRTFVFLQLKHPLRDSRIYSNGETTVYVKSDRVNNTSSP